MATKMNVGYWQEDYFPDGYWQALYWPGYLGPLANFITIARQFAFTSKVKTIAFTTLKRIYNFITKEVL